MNTKIINFFAKFFLAKDVLILINAIKNKYSLTEKEEKEVIVADTFALAFYKLSFGEISEKEFVRMLSPKRIDMISNRMEELCSKFNLTKEEEEELEIILQIDELLN